MFYSLKRKLTVIYYRIHPTKLHVPLKPATVSLGDIIKVNDERHHISSIGRYPKTGDSDVKFYIGTHKLGDE